MTADDWVKIIGACSAAFVVILGAIGALAVKLENYSKQVNGRMDQLLDLTATSSVAQGRAMGRVDEELEAPRPPAPPERPAART